MTRLNPGSDSETQIHARSAFRIAVVLLGATLLLLPVYAYLSFKTGAWQYRVEFILLAGFGCITIMGAWLSRHRRPGLGIKLIIGVILFVGLAGSLLFHGQGLIVGVALVLLPAVIAGQTLPSRAAGRVFLTSLSMGAVALILDIYGPPDRLTSPGALQVLVPVVAGGLVFILAFFMARQIANYPLRLKLVVAFWIVALIPLGVLGFLNERTTRATLTNTANQALLSAATRTASAVDAFIQTNLTDIEANAKFSDWPAYLELPVNERPKSEVEHDIEALLRAFKSKDQINILSYALLDQQGRDVIDTVQSGIGVDESPNAYFQVPLQTDQPYASPIEFSSDDEAFLYFSSPIRDLAGEVIGVLRMRYRAAAMQQLILQGGNLAGERSYAILLDENHLLLAHGLTPELIFKTVTSLDPTHVIQLQAAGRLPPGPVSELSTDLDDLEQGLNNSAAQPIFTAETESNTEEEKDPEQVAIVPLKTQPWRVAFSQSHKVFLAPVEAQTRNTLLVSLLFACLVAAAAIGTAQLLSAPITHLTAVAEKVTAGDLTAQAPAQADDEIGQLGKTFNTMTAQLRQTLGGLEQRVAERTQELERSHTELQQAYESIQEKHEKLLASEKMASLGRLATGIAHEINNPLAAARSALAEIGKLVAEYQSSIGEAEVTPEDHREIAKEMQQALHLAESAVERAAGFVHGIKSQARDLAPQQRVRFNAVPVIRESLLLVSHALRQANCTANFESATDPIELYGSPSELAQIVTNLMTNAIDASAESGGGLITLQLTPKNGGVELTISDHGVGIPPDVLPKIFDFMFTTKPVGLGTGLGLSIVHNIVTAGFGGTISVSSQPRRGTTFTLQLPRPPGA